MSDYLNDVPFVGLYDQFHRTMSSLSVQGMKAVEHEDNEENLDYSVDPLSDPRLDKMDLFNMVDSKDRDKVMNASSSFDTSDMDDLASPSAPVESPSDSGSGE